MRFTPDSRKEVARPARDNARRLRREASMPERVLWNLLRGGRFVVDGEPVKFRRQHPVGPYVADFFCAEASLAIELDGGGHERSHDERRDSVFLTLGIETLRFSVSDFEKHQESALREIAKRVRERRARIEAKERVKKG